jgi:hypothetical protein
MLTIHFGENEEEVQDPDLYFDINYDEEWFDDQLVKDMVLDVDNTEVVNGRMAISAVFGNIPVQKLSGGVKNLILMYKEPGYISGSHLMGDNCSKWIIEIGKRVDCYLVINHGIYLGEGPRDASEFHAHIDNTNQTVETISGFYKVYAEMCALGVF